MSGIKTKADLNKKNWQEMQQPLDFETGRVNKEFDKTYKHKTINPFWGTERDGNKPRKEYLKKKKEYQQYQNDMSPSEKLKYEGHLKDLREKSIREMEK